MLPIDGQMGKYRYNRCAAHLTSEELAVQLQPHLTSYGIKFCTPRAGTFFIGAGAGIIFLRKFQNSTTKQQTAFFKSKALS